MFLSRTVLAAVLIAALGGGLRALAQAPAPTIAELRVTVLALQGELARVQGDYQTLLASCRVDATAPAPRVSSDDVVAAAATRLAERQRQQQLDDDSWLIKDASFTTIEVNRVFVRIRWAFTVKSSFDQPQRFDIAVQFLDANAQVLDTARVYGATIGAFSESPFSGDQLVRLSDAFRVVSVNAVTTRKK
jgi:hypothetical protein